MDSGNYVAPTVFADVAPDARIFQEEIFGPVVALTPFDTDAEALALANDVKYGLAAYLWTSDLRRAHTFAQSVEAGMVWLNSHNVRDLRTPFGGVKASGLGHEGGYRSLDFYTHQQAIHVSLGPVHTARFGASGRDSHDHHPAGRPPLRVRRTRRHRPGGVPGLLRRRARARCHRTRTPKRCTCGRSRSTCTTPWCCARDPRPRWPSWPTASAAPPISTWPRPTTATSGCRVERRPAGATRGIGEAVRVVDPLGFPVEFFHEAEHVERFTQRYDVHGAGALSRLDHFNLDTPDVPAARKYYEGLGFRVSEDIQDDEGTVYAAWMFRKPTVHDVALTGGDGPRLHHIAFASHERHQILHLCDHLGALRKPGAIERGPGRHGVSNAFYLYVRDPDGHRIEIYTHDYYTGDPDNPVITWDVHDNQRRDWWGNPVVPSWYTDASVVLDLDGVAQPVVARAEPREADVTIGADGFSVQHRGGGVQAGRAGVSHRNHSRERCRTSSWWSRSRIEWFSRG